MNKKNLVESLLKKGNDINEEDEVIKKKIVRIVTSSQLFPDQHHCINMGCEKQKYGYYKNVAEIRQRSIKNKPLRSYSLLSARY